MWMYRNSVIFKDCDTKPAKIINVAIKLFDDIRCFNSASLVFVWNCLTSTHTTSTKKSQISSIQKPSFEDRLKINVDAFRKH